ncbi:DnaJ family domain-containing protein [Dermabacter sp. Marseille-Q3180]|uniref:DnaJ family domain-containing protein n=1 Tax=Dermabacter sp. Marseille-Q3180 TaxID=2758090 RepID=UPI002025A73A|nr:DnaJ family domain-containing protein [Dermabacter sp. Marseille-Q3180]
MSEEPGARAHTNAWLGAVGEGAGFIPTAADRAAAAGVFDNLPLAGAQLELPDVHDPDWWIKSRISSGEFDREALLPAAVVLRKEHDMLAHTLCSLPSEDAVREYLEDYNARARRENSAAVQEVRPPSGVSAEAPLLAPIADVEEWIARWRRTREP